MLEVIFLIVLGLVWVSFASIQDLKYREVANWLSFSLIIFALGFRFFWSLFEADNFIFFYQGLIGLGIFLIFGNLFYYSRIFAGGDAKLMIAFGAVLPFSGYFLTNLKIYVLFLIIFLFVGAFYGLLWSFGLVINNFRGFKEEYKKQLNKNKRASFLIMGLSIIIIFFGFFQYLLFFAGILLFILPYFYIYAKAVDEACMVKKIKAKDLVEGDWLYKDVKIGRKIIKSRWDGLNKDEINLLRKNRKQILVRQGIAFVPVFLISFLILVYLFFYKINF